MSKKSLSNLKIVMSIAQSNAGKKYAFQYGAGRALYMINMRLLGSSMILRH